MFCKKCGNQLADGVKFCNKCGEPQNTSAPDRASNMNQNPGSAPQGDTSAAPKKKSKKPLFIIIGVVILLIILIVVLVKIFGSSLSVEDVKSGSLNSYSQKTIGSAFDDYTYFEDVSWEEFEGSMDNGDEADVVEFNATIEMDNLDAYDYDSDDSYIKKDITVQFYQDDDMESDEFEIYGIWIDDIALDDYDFVDILDCIYGDEMFCIIPSDYGMSY